MTQSRNRICRRKTGGNSPTVEIKLNLDTTDYVGPMVFEDGRLARAETPGGFISGDSVYAYVSDHQGNVRRVVNTQTCAVAQETHYYPFGMPFGESVATALATVNGTALQPRRYGGKESVSLGSLTFLDFPARPYDAALARFLTPDPLQDDYASVSPYLYCMGNPMNITDPTGMIVEIEGTPEQREKLKGLITEMRKDKFFDSVYQELEKSKTAFVYKFKTINPPDGHVVSENEYFNAKFDPNNNTIYLNPGFVGCGLYLTTAEETYHAYQTIVEEMYVNIEFEAKVFAGIHVRNMGSPLLYVEPGMEGAYLFFDALYPEDINMSPPYNKMRIPDNLASAYLESGQEFFRVHKTSDISAYRVPITKMPERLMKLLRNYCNGRK